MWDSQVHLLNDHSIQPWQKKTRDKHQPGKQIRFYTKPITWMAQSGYHLYRASWDLIIKHMSKRSYLSNLEIFPTHLPSGTTCQKQTHNPFLPQPMLAGDHIHYPTQACKHTKLVHHPPSNHNITHSHIFYALALHSVSADASCYYPRSPILMLLLSMINDETGSVTWSIHLDWSSILTFSTLSGRSSEIAFR